MVDARILIAEVLGIEPLAVSFVDPPTPEQAARIEKLVARRAARVPLQHLLGRAAFGPLELVVGPGVFIPRLETELLAEWAVAHCPPDGLVVDLCTGSGALAAFVAHHRPGARVVAVELSPEALAYAEKNLAPYPNVQMVAGDVTDPGMLPVLAGRVDLVVSNPPYVPESGDLEPEVYHDPAMAVFSGRTGMDLIPPMLDVVSRLLRPGGAVFLEHDDTTQEAVVAALAERGFTAIERRVDWTERPRFVCAKMKR